VGDQERRRPPSSVPPPDGDLVTVQQAALAVGVDMLTIWSWTAAGWLTQHERVSLLELRRLVERRRERGLTLRPKGRRMVERALVDADVAVAMALDRAQRAGLQLPFPAEDLERIRTALQRRLELLKADGGGAAADPPA
jgi:hypothetical protein